MGERTFAKFLICLPNLLFFGLYCKLIGNIVKHARFVNDDDVRQTFQAEPAAQAEPAVAFESGVAPDAADSPGD